MEHEKINALIENIGKAAIMLLILMLFVLIVLSVNFAHAAEVNLAWDANIDPPVDGYYVFKRTEGEKYDYTKPVCQTSQTTCKVTDLMPATTYYFVARAYLGNEQSGDSNEVNYKPPIMPPSNFRLSVEISVYIDVNGQPIILAGQGMTASP